MIVFSLAHCMESPRWYDGYATKLFNTFTLGLWNPDMLEKLPIPFLKVCGNLGLILETFCWNLWYLLDAFRVLTALLMWTIFRTLNRALNTGKLRVENLPEIIELHFNGTKLLNLFNQLMGPITFTSSVFNILYACFWTNYCLINVEFRLSYIVGFITVCRMFIVFYIVADVNSQAYQISTWVENHFTEIDQIPNKVDKTKLTLFSSLIYSREAIGFKGMHFFTCTQALNIAIGGLILTYTVIVNQVATNTH
ncbi:uncharacterized protein LOC118434504 [Folsomia candida]|nr:uncharacterized protein LOC118434504 [Folsomia candida]